MPVGRRVGWGVFLARVKEGWGTGLRGGDGLILDNLAADKVAGMREAIPAAGTRPESRPLDSPACDPREPVGSMVNPPLNSPHPRMERPLLQAARLASVPVNPKDCRGLFFHTGASVALDWKSAMQENGVLRHRGFPGQSQGVTRPGTVPHDNEHSETNRESIA